MLQVNQIPRIPKESIEAELCKRNFYYFTKEAFQHVFEGEQFIDNWHIKLIAETLQATQEGKIQNVILQVPPRCMKTALTGIFFTCWILARDPSKKIMYVTANEQNVTDNVVRPCKKLINSEWYQKLFPKTQLVIQQSTKLVTTKGGYIQGFGVQGNVTGRGANLQILDDLISATDAASKVELEKVNYIYDNTLANRINNPKKDTRICIAQRLAPNDIIGHLLSKEKERWEFVCLPMRYDGPGRFASSIGLKDPRTQVGEELLWPERFPKKIVDEFEITLGQRGFQAQYQQNPSPLGGNLFLKSYFSNRINNTDIIARYISADTSEGAKDTSAYTAFVVGELTSDYRLFIRHVTRERLTLPQQFDELIRLAKLYEYQLKRIIVEHKSSGVPLLQTLESAADPWIYKLLYGVDPHGDKVARAQLASLWCENGSVLLPEQSPAYPWVDTFTSEIFDFPNCEFKDQTDSFSQLIMFLEPKLEEGFLARNKFRSVK